MHNLLFVIPIFSAFTGWLVSTVLLRFLFHPAKPTTILGITIQGVVPAQQGPLAEKLGRLAAAEFTSRFDLESKVNDPANLQKVMPVIEQHVDEFLRVKLKAEIPMISMFIGDKTIATLKKVFLQEIEVLFPQIMKEFAGNIKNELNVQKMVAERIQGISMSAMEKQFDQQAGKQITAIRLAASLIGLLVGLVEILMIALIR